MNSPLVLIGNPNVGKSALFGALTGAYVAVSNYPGTTVELAEGEASKRGHGVHVRRCALHPQRRDVRDLPALGGRRPSRPLVEPLARLSPGGDADVVYMVAPDSRRLTRLAALGLSPGARVHVLQTAPAAVVRIGHTTVAFENALAEDVYVRRIARS